MEKIDKRSKEYRNQKQSTESTGGKIQEIIDSKQAPGMRMPTIESKFKEKYMQDNNGRDPNVPLDWSERRQKGGNLVDKGL